ncbi:hypothetical protein Desti_2916 [Desulfomonile tiedjei DSM 6799]|uniref:Uncharacterized protein n=1 Tax=Desulfomonile tiedjei (strain ATCC 49306 / DSM 6799 / DCB-1) TaxID=706587 RepID=I4C7P4_DESTA|nr:hypothetical protein Desti_2916 [Desulfomonile tiedjei DSM 6799]
MTFGNHCLLVDPFRVVEPCLWTSRCPRVDENVSKVEIYPKSWHDFLLPGNELPGYYPTSLWDVSFLSREGAAENSPGLQPRVVSVARFWVSAQF